MSETALTKHQLEDYVHKLEVPLHQIIVVGSGALTIAGVSWRPAGDADLVASEKAYEWMEDNLDWKEVGLHATTGTPYLRKWPYDISRGAWHDGLYQPVTFDELMQDAWKAESGIAVVNLGRLWEWKMLHARPKDHRDAATLLGFLGANHPDLIAASERMATRWADA